MTGEKGAAVSTNQPSYRILCDLEIRSGFSYRQQNWLVDIRPELLTDQLILRITQAKEKAHTRKAIERRVPKELLFANHGGRHGWPSSQPTLDQCEILAAVRQDIAKLMGAEITKSAGIEIKYTNAHAIYNRYKELLEQKKVQLAKQSRHRHIPRYDPTSTNAPLLGLPISGLLNSGAVPAESMLSNPLSHVVTEF